MESKPYTNNYGDTYWRLPDGTLHREDGPAVILSNGMIKWYNNNLKHRTNGPAVEFGELKQWWINGIPISYYLKRLKIDYDENNITDEDVALVLIYEGYNWKKWK